MLLPASAREMRVDCIDSACGKIDVGTWTLLYDRGPLAGPGDTLRPAYEAEQESLCTESIGGRRLFIQTVRYPRRPREQRYFGGKLVGAAATVAGDGGLYLSVITRSPTALREFLAVVRTLQVR